MSQKDVKVRISGVTPLLMNRFPGILPTERRPTTVTQQWIDEDHKKKWLRAAHFANGTFHLPPEMLEGALYAAGTKMRKKDAFKRSVMVVEDFVKLLVGVGGKPPAPLTGELEDYYTPEYIDIRGVPTRTGPTVEQCRPIFRNWAVEFTYRYDGLSVNAGDIRKAMDNMYLGSFRPRFGRLRVEKFQEL